MTWIPVTPPPASPFTYAAQPRCFLDVPGTHQTHSYLRPFALAVSIASTYPAPHTHMTHSLTPFRSLPTRHLLRESSLTHPLTALSSETISIQQSLVPYPGLLIIFFAREVHITP